MNPRISIIIPCFNQGVFLKDALESIQKLPNQDLVEIIIINDGSSDQATNDFIRELGEAGMNVIVQENKGLPAARNAGISKARGEYILPLDADNKIRPEYVVKAISILDSDMNVAVVYGDAAFFGDKNGIWQVGEFNLQRLMIHNYIDACAVIRKSALVTVGAYDAKGIGGVEDWDLWLRMAWHGYLFYYVPEVLFDYRVVRNSMSRKLNKDYEKRNYYTAYLHLKYPEKLGQQWVLNYAVQRFKSSPIKFVFKLILIAFFPRYYQRLLKKNKIVSGL